MDIRLVYGHRQRFRSRLPDLHVLGRVRAAAYPLATATYRLNDGQPVPFYVEPPGGEDVDWRFQYKASPARLRLPFEGDFAVEVPADAPELRAGENRLTILVEDGTGARSRADVRLTWDPTPVPLPLDLSDLAAFEDVQAVGQVVNGAFELDRARDAIRTVGPVAPDALLVLGSPHASQEATYGVVFDQPRLGKYLGLSDYFVRHEAEAPPLGIKPGWSTAGLATVTYGWRPGAPPEVRPLGPGESFDGWAAAGGPAGTARTATGRSDVGGAGPAGEARPLGQARAWISFGDNTHQGERWLVKTDPPAELPIEAGMVYRVRHQVVLTDDVNRARFRVWPDGRPEPSAWLCDVDNREVDRRLPRFEQASFALFQHTGAPTTWLDVRVRPL